VSNAAPGSVIDKVAGRMLSNDAFARPSDPVLASSPETIVRVLQAPFSLVRPSFYESLAQPPSESMDLCLRRHLGAVDLLSHHLLEDRAEPLRVLNASGVQNGHQEAAFFAANQVMGWTHGRVLDWTSLEHPDAEAFANPVLRGRLESLGVQLLPHDFASARTLPDSTAFDVVLFTEIAEHLDHHALVNTLAALSGAIRPHGLILITTPNAANLAQRVKFAVHGRLDLYFGDGQANLQRGMWGHITAFDWQRLARLCTDAGLIPLAFRTRDYEPLSWRTPRRSARSLIARALPFAGTYLELVAAKGQRDPIPMKT